VYRDAEEGSRHPFLPGIAKGNAAYVRENIDPNRFHADLVGHVVTGKISRTEPIFLQWRSQPREQCPISQLRGGQRLFPVAVSPGERLKHLLKTVQTEAGGGEEKLSES